MKLKQNNNKINFSWFEQEYQKAQHKCHNLDYYERRMLKREMTYKKYMYPWLSIFITLGVTFCGFIFSYFKNSIYDSQIPGLISVVVIMGIIGVIFLACGMKNAFFILLVLDELEKKKYPCFRK